MPKISNSDVDFSLLFGFKFRFYDLDRKIEFVASAWSGKEEVMVGDKPVSTLRNYSMSSIHKFLLDEIPYQLEFKTGSLLQGNWQCLLIRDGERFKLFRLYYEKGSKFTKFLGPIVGVIFGTSFVVFPQFLHVTIPVFLLSLIPLSFLKRKLICEVEEGDQL